MICSLDFVRRSKQRLEHLCDAEWDLMIVDEAHHLVWSEEAPSREYQAIEQLAERVPGVLLLTATPEQLGMESHFARLRLLDPNRFHDFEQFVEEQQNYRPVADAVALLLAGNKLSDTELNTLGDLIGEQDIEPLLQAANSDRDDAQAARQELVSMLMDRHGTSRVLFRNTRNGVKASRNASCTPFVCRCPPNIRRRLKSPALWVRVKPQKSARAICSTRNRFIRNLKAIPVHGGTSTRASSG